MTIYKHSYAAKYERMRGVASRPKIISEKIDELMPQVKFEAFVKEPSLLAEQSNFPLLDSVLNSISNTETRSEFKIKKNISTQEASSHRELPWMLTYTAKSKCNRLIEENLSSCEGSQDHSQPLFRKCDYRDELRQSLSVYRNLFSYSQADKLLYSYTTYSDRPIKKLCKSKVITMNIEGLKENNLESIEKEKDDSNKENEPLSTEKPGKKLKYSVNEHPNNFNEFLFIDRCLDEENSDALNQHKSIIHPYSSRSKEGEASHTTQVNNKIKIETKEILEKSVLNKDKNKNNRILRSNVTKDVCLNLTKKRVKVRKENLVKKSVKKPLTIELRSNSKKIENHSYK